MTDAPHPYPTFPIRVLHLRGDESAIGAQHAEQLGPHAKEGMVHFYLDFWRRMSQPEVHGVKKYVVKFAKYYLENFLRKNLVAQIPDGMCQRLKSFSDVLDLDYDELLTTFILPDMLPMLQAYAVRYAPGSFVPVLQPPRFGCSSFVHKGSQFLSGRNLDFPGVAFWDRYPILQCIEKPGSLKYIGVASAGVAVAGISGVNEAQISVALHQHYSRHTNQKGVLPFIVGEQILEKATSLDEAEAIIRQKKIASSWAFVLTDGKTREGRIYETDARGRGRREITDFDPLLTHSNFFQVPDLKAGEYAATGRMNWDNYWRNERMKTLVNEAGADLTPERAVQIISDHYDSYWQEEKPVNRTVSQVYNIQSYVIDTENMKLWMAVGDPPVHLGHFEEFDLGKIFAGEEGRTGVKFPAYQFQNDDVRRSKQNYVLSFVAGMDGRVEESKRFMDACMDDHFMTEAAVTAGVLSLKMEDVDEAERLFRTAMAKTEEKMKEKGLTTPPPEYFEGVLFLARALDIKGKRSEAVSTYRRVAQSSDLEDTNLRRVAQKAGPYTQANISSILTPFSTYVPFQ